MGHGLLFSDLQRVGGQTSQPVSQRGARRSGRSRGRPEVTRPTSRPTGASSPLWGSDRAAGQGPRVPRPSQAGPGNGDRRDPSSTDLWAPGTVPGTVPGILRPRRELRPERGGAGAGAPAGEPQWWEWREVPGPSWPSAGPRALVRSPGERLESLPVEDKSPACDRQPRGVRAPHPP